MLNTSCEVFHNETPFAAHAYLVTTQFKSEVFQNEKVNALTSIEKIDLHAAIKMY